jgi:glycosyltransferase involved in cell wall biosynthesis
MFNRETTPHEDKDHFRLTVASTLVKRYGIQTLIEAVPLLVKDIPELMVDIIGEGEYREGLEQVARDTGVADYLNFTGFIPYEDVIATISRAHVGVAPMLADVGAPNKIFEYFALSKPTVASLQPSLQAVVDGECVMYFEPGNERELADRILELYRDPKKRAELVSNASRFYDSYQWNTMKRNYLRVYEECLADKYSDKSTKGVV